MAGGAGKLVIQTRVHRTQFWILIPLQVGPDLAVDMVLDTGSAFSALSSPVAALLTSQGLLIPAARQANRYLLRGLKIQGQDIPDLRVRIGERVTEVGAEGILGLNFLRQFSELHYHVPSLRLTLTDP